jgi:hypothetical protein
MPTDAAQTYHSPFWTHGKMMVLWSGRPCLFETDPRGSQFPTKNSQQPSSQPMGRTNDLLLPVNIPFPQVFTPGSRILEHPVSIVTHSRFTCSSCFLFHSFYSAAAKRSYARLVRSGQTCVVIRFPSEHPSHDWNRFVSVCEPRQQRGQCALKSILGCARWHYLPNWHFSHHLKGG